MSPERKTSPGTAAPTEERKLCPLLSAGVLLACALVLKTCILSICMGRVWTCCPRGWEPFQANCYFFSKDIMTWDGSDRNCTGMGSHLVVINTGAEQDFISNYVKRTVLGILVENYHIGLTQQGKGEWRWVDLTPYNETTVFWIPGEPNNLIVEKCVAVDISQKDNRNWNNFPCIVPAHRICETAATNI